MGIMMNDNADVSLDTLIAITGFMCIMVMFGVVLLISFINSTTTYLPYDIANTSEYNESVYILPVTGLRVHLDSNEQSETTYKITVKTTRPKESVSVWWNQEICTPVITRFESGIKCTDNPRSRINPQTFIGQSDDTQIVESEISVGGLNKRNPVVVVSGNTVLVNVANVSINRV